MCLSVFSVTSLKMLSSVPCVDSTKSTKSIFSFELKCVGAVYSLDLI